MSGAQKSVLLGGTIGGLGTLILAAIFTPQNLTPVRLSLWLLGVVMSTAISVVWCKRLESRG